MPLPKYGVLKGTVVGKLDSEEAVLANPAGKPHYQLKLDAGGTLYRVAINVKSDQRPANLQLWKSENYMHPITDKFADFQIGYTHLDSNARSGALDFIRGNLFDMSEMVILPAGGDPSGNDLNDIFNVYIKHAMETPGTLIYAFGSLWHDENTDPYFGFDPGNGIHDIHMNQGNEGSHARDNGVYQDGALFIYYPDEKRYTALFLKFQSQHVHTDDHTAENIDDPKGNVVTPEVDTPIVISAALVNPEGDDAGNEMVYLMNTSNRDIDISGWSILDKNDRADVIGSMTIAAGQVLRYQLSGSGCLLANSGGTITLVNKDGLKVSGVSYTGSQARQGYLIQF